MYETYHAQSPQKQYANLINCVLLIKLASVLKSATFQSSHIFHDSKLHGFQREQNLMVWFLLPVTAHKGSITDLPWF